LLFRCRHGRLGRREGTSRSKRLQFVHLLERLRSCRLRDCTHTSSITTAANSSPPTVIATPPLSTPHLSAHARFQAIPTLGAESIRPSWERQHCKHCTARCTLHCTAQRTQPCTTTQFHSRVPRKPNKLYAQHPRDDPTAWFLPRHDWYLVSHNIHSSHAAGPADAPA
jgi:hypothetical protein